MRADSYLSSLARVESLQAAVSSICPERRGTNELASRQSRSLGCSTPGRTDRRATGHRPCRRYVGPGNLDKWWLDKNRTNRLHVQKEERFSTILHTDIEYAVLVPSKISLRTSLFEMLNLT